MKRIAIAGKWLSVALVGACGFLSDVTSALCQQNQPPLQLTRASGGHPQDVEFIVSPTVPGVPNAFPASLPSYSLTDLERIALGRHPALAQAAAQVEAARGRWVQSGLRPNPTFGYSGQEIGNEGTVGQQGLYASREFVMGNKLGLSQSAAAERIRAAEAAWRTTEMRVMADLRIAFINALVAQERLGLAQEIQRVSDDGVTVARARVEARESAQVDLIQAQIEASRAGVLVTNAQAELDQAWRRLTVAVGGETLEREPLLGTLVGNIPDFDWQGTWNRVMDSNPLLANAQAQIAAARWNIQRQGAEPIPNVTVQAGVSYGAISDHTFTNLQLSIPIPVNDANQGTLQAARAEFSSAQRNLDRVMLQLERSLADVFASYQAANRQVEWYETDILKNAGDALEIIRGTYRLGETDYTAVLTAQRTFFDARSQYLNALQAAHVAAVRLDFLLLEDAITQ